MNFGLKEVSLYIGALLVSTGGRMLIDGFVAGIPFIILALILFIIGQSITRYEDFPNGGQRIISLESWLAQKEIFLRKPTKTKQSQNVNTNVNTPVNTTKQSV